MVCDLLDDRLPLPARHRVETHLAGCPACAAHTDQVRATIRACRALARTAPGPSPPASLLRAFRRA